MASKHQKKKILDQFWENLGNKTPATISGYKVKIGHYMAHFYPDYTREKMAGYVDHYFREHKDHFTDFKDFLRTSDAVKNAAPLTAGQVFKTVLNFLRLCDVVFTEKTDQTAQKPTTNRRGSDDGG